MTHQQTYQPHHQQPTYQQPQQPYQQQPYQHAYQQPYQQSYQQPAAPEWGASPTSAVHWVVPVGRSWQSVTAGYVALFAIFFWPLGPVALGLGVWAFARGRHGGHGRGRATFAVVVGALTTFLLLAVLNIYLKTL